MKTHYSPAESDGSIDSENGICGIYSESLVSDWNYVTCKKCKVWRPRYKLGAKVDMENNIKDMGLYNIDIKMKKIAVTLGKSDIEFKEGLDLLDIIIMLFTALKEISKGEGPYDMDKLKHASNCIDSMKSIANNVFIEILKTDRGSAPDPKDPKG